MVEIGGSAAGAYMMFVRCSVGEDESSPPPHMSRDRGLEPVTPHQSAGGQYYWNGAMDIPRSPPPPHRNDLTAYRRPAPSRV